MNFIKGNLYLALGIIILAALSYCYGRYVQPANEITKIQTVEKEVIHNNIVTATREVIHPDGTKEEITTTTDTSTKTDDIRHNETISKNTEKQWFVLAGASKGSLLDVNYVYSVSVNRRILGPVFVGLSGTSEKQLGLNVGLEF